MLDLDQDGAPVLTKVHARKNKVVKRARGSPVYTDGFVLRGSHTGAES
jgi:hypothetical protein